ncbi:MAG: hypothetical protein J1E34_10030 [Oscillospiraceae bacterium]|nr:hypothetical protein [Oscillospiraceae bacterium]
MDFFDSLISLLRSVFRALTQFLGKSIPFVSDFEGLFGGDSNDETDGE